MFYRKLRKELEEYGFVVNPYDPCVANKMCEVPKRDKRGRVVKDKNGKTMTEEKQMTVCWHVDDLMVSCLDDFELTKFSCYLARLYNGYGGKLAMHTGPKHDYLGVDYEFTGDGTVDVSMV